MKIINDEFSRLPISKQRRYQLRRQRDGRCTQCGATVIGGKRCLKHLVQARERQRKTNKMRRRYYNTLSYRLQKKIGGPRRRRATSSFGKRLSRPSPAKR